MAIEIRARSQPDCASSGPGLRWQLKPALNLQCHWQVDSNLVDLAPGLQPLTLPGTQAGSRRGNVGPFSVTELVTEEATYPKTPDFDCEYHFFLAVPAPQLPGPAGRGGAALLGSAAMEAASTAGGGSCGQFRARRAAAERPEQPLLGPAVMEAASTAGGGSLHWRTTLPGLDFLGRALL